MIDLIRCRGRGSRFAAVTVAAMTLFALVLVAAPAYAVAPASAENFNPDEVPSSDSPVFTAAMVLSDRNDGVNSTFHATTVTSTDATIVEYYLCAGAAEATYEGDEVTGAGGDPDPAGTAGCSAVLGTDSSAEPGGAGAEVYEAEIDLPASFEDLTDDGTDAEFVAWVCTGASARVVANCEVEAEDDVEVDDAGTGTPSDQTSSGEITTPAHPSNVSNEGFAVAASTSPDVTEVAFCIVIEDNAGTAAEGDDESADEGDGTAGDGDPTDVFPFPTTCAGDSTPNNPVPDQANKKTWSDVFTATETPNNREFALVLYEFTGGGAGVICTGGAIDCQLDSHYLFSSIAEATSATVSWEDEDDPPDPPFGDCDEDFAAAGGPVTSISTTPGTDDLSGCIFDQSGNLITDAEHWAFQISPKDPDASASDALGLSGEDAGDDEGEENDTNGDFFFEQVDGDPGDDADADDRADQETELDSAGTYTVVFCQDSDNNAEDLAVPGPQSATPCSGESLTATATIEIVPEADHVHVKKLGTEGSLCHTGSSTTTAPAGSVVNLVGCALNTTPSVEQPAPDTHVLWIVNPAGNPQDPGQIQTQENLTDQAGKADAAITSGGGAAEKTTTVRFCRDEFPFGGDGNGICDSVELGAGFEALQADFQINWTQAAVPPGSCPQVGGYNKITGSRSDDKLKGGRDCDKIRGRAGDDKLSGKGEDDLLIGGRGFDICRGGPGKDLFRGCEVKKKGSQVAVG